MKLINFLTESNSIEGIFTEPTEEQVKRAKLFLRLSEIKITDLCNIVRIFQPGALIRSIHGMDVYVGNHNPPNGGPHIPNRLQDILDNYTKRTPLNAYYQHHDYETLHPFMDGNGRSGRLLWLWKMGGMKWLEKSSIGFLHTWYYQSLQFGRR